MLLALAGGALYHLQAFPNHARLLGHNGNHPGLLALFLAGEHDDLVTFFNMQFAHNFQIASGASEIIFMNFFSRSPRAIGPKIRVPLGFNSLSIMTQALRSKRRSEPSSRRMACRVRTMTAS